MKIIDLLNKIANGEEVPKKINYDGKTYNYEDRDYFASDYGYLFYRSNVSGMLNDEVDILEEAEKKIPEKLNLDCFLNNNDLTQVDADLELIIKKINEIIDCLKSKGE